MGEAELDRQRLIIHSHIYTYGDAANEQLTESIRDEIETMWNEPHSSIRFAKQDWLITFRIRATYHPKILPEEIFENSDPRNNYFRIESYVMGNISFVDGLGCNTGLFLLENLYQGSTTAAHEYGHTLGLPHPLDLNLRGKGTPGIMYPRGTLVDAQYQYNPNGKSGDSSNGGTMHPMHRRVLPNDIANLRLHKLDFRDKKAVVGEFSSVYHESNKS